MQLRLKFQLAMVKLKQILLNKLIILCSTQIAMVVFQFLIKASEEPGTFFRTLKCPYKGTEVKHQIWGCLWDACSHSRWDQWIQLRPQTWLNPSSLGYLTGEQTIQLIQCTGDHNCQENSLLKHSSLKCVFSRNTLRNPFKSQGINAHS